MTDLIYGIDLGTTNSAIAYAFQGRHGAEVSLVRNLDESDLTPSVVYFRQDGSPIVGQNALERYVSEPDRTCIWVKREMGTEAPWRIEATPEDFYITPTQVSAHILRYMTESAARKLELEAPPSKAVITVPAYFGDAQRQATLDAASIAGIEATLIEEPTAALLDYVQYFSHENRLGELLTEGKADCVVFDFGGGTFDVSVCSVELRDSDIPSIRVIATDGDSRLGGTDIDVALARLAIDKAMRERPGSGHLDKLAEALEEFDKEGYVKDPEISHILAQHLMKAESIKKQLSTDQSRVFQIPRVGGRVVDVTIYREEFERQIESIINRIEEIMDRVLQRARESSGGRIASWDDIDRCVLIGGSTKIPIVRELVETACEGRVSERADADRSVARGAAIKSAFDSGVLMISDLGFSTAHDYGILDSAGKMELVIIPSGSKYPAEYSQTFPVPFSLDTGFHFNIGQRFGEGCKSIGVKSFYHPFMYTGDKLEVSLSIDGNGLINFKALDPKTNERLDEVITSQSGMTDQEIRDARESLNNAYEEGGIG